MSDSFKFTDIKLGGRGSSTVGTLTVSDAGITWKKSGGLSSKTVDKEDIAKLLWSLAPGGGLLRVRQHDKVTVIFHGFAKADLESLKRGASALGAPLEVEDLSLAGHNWGELKVHGSSVAFQSTDGKHIFELPLTEIGEVQGNREDAILEFHVDDATLGSSEDALCSITFVVPEENEEFKGQGEDAETPADVFKEVITTKADTLAGSGDDALAALDKVSSMFPRGRYDLTLHPIFLEMDGQNHQFKFRYSNIDRIYTLPRQEQAGNLVIVHLVNAIRRGQTYYEWIVFFFDDRAVVEELELRASDEFIAKKNKENVADMSREMNGPMDQVLTRLLRGLSGAKVTKGGSFRAADGLSSFLPCTYRNDSGTLYPLERSFLYLLKPELIPYDHIESVVFERQQTGMHASHVRTFDLAVNIRATAATRTKSFLFKSIQKTDWKPLLDFMELKGVQIANLEQAKQGFNVSMVQPLEGVNPDMGADSDEDDDDFAGEEGGGEEDESDFDGGSDSDSADSDAELEAEDGISVEAITGKPSKKKEGGSSKTVKAEPEDDGAGAGSRPAGAPRVKADSDADDGSGDEPDEDVKPEVKPAKKPKASKAEKANGGDKPLISKPSKKRKAEAAEGGKGKGEKKKRAKKDKDAPKNARSAFMFFSSVKREEVKNANPGISMPQVASKLGEMWKAMGPDDKVRYNEMAAEDKERYKEEMAAYKAAKAEADGA